MTVFGKANPTTSEARQGGITVIAKSSTFEGELAGGAPVRVEGVVKGSVALSAPLEVAPGATVEAEVRATRVVIAGTVVGNVTASEMVSLESSALLRGDLVCPALQVVEGATLEGRVTMRSGTPPPPVSAPSVS